MLVLRPPEERGGSMLLGGDSRALGPLAALLSA